MAKLLFIYDFVKKYWNWYFWKFMKRKWSDYWFVNSWKKYNEYSIFVTTRLIYYGNNIFYIPHKKILWNYIIFLLLQIKV